MRFGRLPHNSVALDATPIHRFAAVLPLLSLDRTAVEFTPGLFANDTLPDCTAAALANAAIGVAALNGFELNVAAAKVPAFYGDCLGNPPDLAATDGCVMLDVLRRQEKAGFDIGPETLSGRFGRVDYTNRTALALGMEWLGPLYSGITLRDRDMQNIGAGVWDVAPGRDDGPVVGGHAVVLWDYAGLADNGRVRVGTWGAWQIATWDWVAARTDEVYGLVWRQLSRVNGSNWNDMSADELLAHIEAPL